MKKPLRKKPLGPHLLQDADQLVVLFVLRGEVKDLGDAVVGLEVRAANQHLVGVVQELAGKRLGREKRGKRDAGAAVA